MSIRSKKGELAIRKPTFTKIVANLNAGFATIQQRTQCQLSDLLMDYLHDGVLYKAGQTQVILRGDAGLRDWSKHGLTIAGSSADASVGSIEFVLCPESEIVGFIVAKCDKEDGPASIDDI